MSESLKQKIAAPSERSRIKQALLDMAGVNWQEKGEQSCEYRLDGQHADGWLRVKQYTNGTLYIETSSTVMTDKLAAMLPGAAAPKSKSAKATEKTSGKLNIAGAYIGTDESGKGDYFGPLVIAGVYVTEKTIPILVELGVMDSKKINDKIIGSLARDITATVGTSAISCIEIGPKRYNELYQKFKSGGKNLNHLLAWGHATAIENLLAENPDCAQAVADQFGNERYILSQLKDKGRQIKLHQTHRAEANVGVAAASIIARNRFVMKMDKLGHSFDLEFSKGANPKVKNQARAFVAKYGAERLNEVAKLHFKTTQEITG